MSDKVEIPNFHFKYDFIKRESKCKTIEELSKFYQQTFQP